MKKIFCILLTIIMIFFVTGCKENSQNNGTASTATNEIASITSILSAGDTFETESASIRFIGVEKGNPINLPNENSYVVKVEVKNKTATPKDYSSIFRITAYQNNIEVEDIRLIYTDDSEQRTMLTNRDKKIMNGGTILVGKPFVLEDTSPLTVIVEELEYPYKQATAILNVEE